MSTKVSEFARSFCSPLKSYTCHGNCFYSSTYFLFSLSVSFSAVILSYGSTKEKSSWWDVKENPVMPAIVHNDGLQNTTLFVLGGVVVA